MTNLIQTGQHVSQAAKRVELLCVQPTKTWLPKTPRDVPPSVAMVFSGPAWATASEQEVGGILDAVNGNSMAAPKIWMVPATPELLAKAAAQRLKDRRQMALDALAMLFRPEGEEVLPEIENMLQAGRDAMARIKRALR